MLETRNSLGIKNTGGRATGLGESPSSSTNLFRKLRELDRKITELDNIIRLNTYGKWYFKKNILIKEYDLIPMWFAGKSEFLKLIERRIKLDQKRKEIRIKRKLNGKS